MVLRIVIEALHVVLIIHVSKKNVISLTTVGLADGVIREFVKIMIIHAPMTLNVEMVGVVILILIDASRMNVKLMLAVMELAVLMDCVFHVKSILVRLVTALQDGNVYKDIVHNENVNLIFNALVAFTAIRIVGNAHRVMKPN